VTPSGTRTRELSALPQCSRAPSSLEWCLLWQLFVLPSMLYFIAHSFRNPRHIIYIVVRLSHQRRDGIRRGGRIMPVSPISISWFSLRCSPLLPLQCWWQFPPRNVGNLIPPDATFQRTLICSYAYLLTATSWRRMEEWRYNSPIRNVTDKWIWVKYEQFHDSDLKKKPEELVYLWYTYCYQPEHILLVLPTHDTCDGLADNPRAFKYMALSLEIKMYVYFNI